MKLGIRSKLFLASVALITLSVAVADAYLTRQLNADLSSRMRNDLLVQLRLIARESSRFGASLDDSSRWDAWADELGALTTDRVTVVRGDGVVIGDSDVALEDLTSVQNHSTRLEIMNALASGRGSSIRFSQTVHQRLMYVALPFERGGRTVGVVRLAKPLTEIDHAIGRLRRLVLVASALGLLAAILMSSLAAHWMSKTVRSLTAAARRMAGGDLSARTRLVGSDEVAELGRALDQLASGLMGALGELRTERDLMSGVLHGMQEGVLLLDRTGRVALANLALRDMLLLGPDVVGKSLLEMIRNAELKRILDEAAKAHEAISDELDLGDLKPRRLLVHAAALPGEPGGLLAVFVDVTDLRRLETMRRDFVANVSHELRTPIATVRSAAETLRRALDTQPDAAPDFVDIIERQAERLQSLVEDLLDLARIESRQLKLSVEPIALPPMMRHMISLFRDRADARRIVLETEIATDMPLIRADRRALEQVMTNLLDNAVKYATEGAHVLIRAVPEGGSVRIYVQDTGPGIEAKHLPRIFERFYRVDAGRSRDLGGTGLGLAIVKHLVEAMEGHLGVESAPGQGTTFDFALPAAA